MHAGVPTLLPCNSWGKGGWLTPGDPGGKHPTPKTKQGNACGSSTSPKTGAWTVGATVWLLGRLAAIGAPWLQLPEAPRTPDKPAGANKVAGLNLPYPTRGNMPCTTTRTVQAFPRDK